MHHVQSKILQKLLYADASNYASLKPDGVESNHFAYHLEQLLKEGLVEKRDKKYALSAAGQTYIDKLSQEQMSTREQPHIVTAIDITAPTGETLLFKRNFQPYINLVGLPMGKLHNQELVAEAAARELKEKTGLTGISLHQRGIVYIDARRGGRTISKVLYHIFQGTVPSTLPVTIPAGRGECFWVNFTKLDASTLMPGFLRVKELLEGNDDRLFFEEIAVDLS